MNLTENELITMKSALFSYERYVKTWEIEEAAQVEFDKIEGLHAEIDQELNDLEHEEESLFSKQGNTWGPNGYL